MSLLFFLPFPESNKNIEFLFPSQPARANGFLILWAFLRFLILIQRIFLRAEFFYYLATDDMLKRGSQLNFESWALYFIYFLSTITFKTRNETNIVWPRGLFDSDKNFLSSAGKMIVSIGIEAITENQARLETFKYHVNNLLSKKENC